MESIDWTPRVGGGARLTCPYRIVAKLIANPTNNSQWLCRIVGILRYFTIGQRGSRTATPPIVHGKCKVEIFFLVQLDVPLLHY